MGTEEGERVTMLPEIINAALMLLSTIAFCFGGMIMVFLAVLCFGKGVEE